MCIRDRYNNATNVIKQLVDLIILEQLNGSLGWILPFVLNIDKTFWLLYNEFTNKQVKKKYNIGIILSNTKGFVNTSNSLYLFSFFFNSLT